MTVPSHINQAKRSPKSNLHLGLQPAPAWTVIIGFIVFTILGILVGGKILNLAFPAISFAIALFLYQKYPVLYMGFSWWIWFLSPLIRRLVDYRAGFSDQSLILMAPLLVVLVTLPSLIQYILKSYPYNRANLPFVLAFVGIFYSFSIGLVTPLSEGSNIFLITRNSLIVAFVNWLTPLSFSFFVLSNWRNYPSFKANMESTFFWGGLVMGSYGLIQFFRMPPWDAAWQQEAIKVGFGNVMGSIWSTVNSPGHLAVLLIPCVLLILSNGKYILLRIFTAVVMILDILLTNNRTGFIALCVGLILFAGNLKPRLQMRLILVFFVIILCILPLANVGSFSNNNSEKDLFGRILTLSNVKEDASFQARQSLYKDLTEKAFFNPIGYGMSSLNLADSGLILIFYEMGWLGITPFIGGLILLFLNIFNFDKKPFKSVNTLDSIDLMDVDQSFKKAALASSYAILIMIPNGNLFTGMGGILIWTFPSIVMAGNKYYQYQPMNLINSDKVTNNFNNYTNSQ